MSRRYFRSPTRALGFLDQAYSSFGVRYHHVLIDHAGYELALFPKQMPQPAQMPFGAPVVLIDRTGRDFAGTTDRDPVTVFSLIARQLATPVVFAFRFPRRTTPVVRTDARLAKVLPFKKPGGPPSLPPSPPSYRTVRHS